MSKSDKMKKHNKAVREKKRAVEKLKQIPINNKKEELKKRSGLPSQEEIEFMIKHGLI